MIQSSWKLKNIILSPIHKKPQGVLKEKVFRKEVKQVFTFFHFPGCRTCQIYIIRNRTNKAKTKYLPGHCRVRGASPSSSQAPVPPVTVSAFVHLHTERFFPLTKWVLTGGNFAALSLYLPIWQNFRHFSLSPLG